MLNVCLYDNKFTETSLHGDFLVHRLAISTYNVGLIDVHYIPTPLLKKPQVHIYTLKC